MQSLCLAWGVWIGFVCLVGSARAEGGAPDAEMRKLIEQLADQLQEKASGRRRSAVRKLAKLDDADGWGLVLSALDDPKGEVADEAQLAIAQIEGERQVKELLGRDGLRSKQEWVRVRVAEALGRMEVTLPMREVGRALDPRDVESCSALLWSVERLADAGHVKDDADKLVREVDDCLSKRVDARVRAAGVSALVALACAASVGDLEGVVREDLVRDFMRLAGDKSSEVRCAWVAGLARLGGDANCSKMIACLADRAANVRLQAVESLLSVADRRVLEALSDQLERESNDRVISRIVTGLRAVTGMKYRADPRSWKRWLEGVSEDWVGMQPSGKTAVYEDGMSRAKLAGLPLPKGAMVFLVDFSGSTWSQRIGTRTRKEVLDETIRDALTALPETARFNVVPYTAQPLPWRESVELAKRRAVRDALEYFEDCKANGPGNVFDALMFAFSDPDVESIVLLTDGAPSGGRRWNLGLMVELLRQANRYRKLSIDVVLVGASSRLHRYWEEVAADSGGRCLEARLGG